MSDAINPDHYKRLPAEAIEIIEAMIAGAPDNKAAYLHGQGAKYDLRLWKKGKSLEDYLIDWDKHIWYALRLKQHLVELIEQQKAADIKSLMDYPFGEPEPAIKQSSRTEEWIPKIGDWVRINKPDDTQDLSTFWWPEMDKYDGQIIQVKEIEEDGVVHDNWCFLFEWLQPSDEPRLPLASDKIPEGYRKLNDSSEEPRQIGDLRWSVSEKRYIEISVDEIGYANRDNWAACRKIETNEPPDGWRWLEVGEVIRKGDLPYKDGLVYATEPIMLGMALQEHWKPMIRRNKFEVGEKVVHVSSKDILQVDEVAGDVRLVDVRGSVWRCRPEMLSPYIEEQS